MEIKYDKNSESLHTKILAALLERINLADTHISDNFDRWRNTEKYYQLYKKSNEKDGKAIKAWQEGDTDFKSLVMPYSYAQLLTAHAYMVNVFLNRDPIFQTDSLNGDGTMKELALESLLQYQVKAGCMEKKLSVWLMDVLRYGVGFIGNYWDEEVVRQTYFEEEEVTDNGISTGEVEQVRKTRTIKGYEGSKLFNVLPYDVLPDPRVALCNYQDGEFFGRRVDLSILDIKKGAYNDKYFNIKEVETRVASSKEERENRDASFGNNTRDRKPSTGTPRGKRVGDVPTVEIFVRLIPKDWGLGDGEYPEIWVFTVADKQIIIQADPAGMLDDKFPYHVLECEVDGYENKARGLLEVTAPLNDVLTWLFDSHMYNKRQVMNNQFVGDPSAIVMKDVERKDPGKFIRLRPTAYGRDVRTIISQLPVTDVTTQNFQDAQVIERNMQRVAGINDDVAGQSAPSSRRSATEFRGTTGFASNRLQNNAYWFSVTGFSSLAKSLIVHSQQLYTMDMKVKVAGDNIKGIDSITVKPEDIAGMFDITTVDGTLPVDRMAQAQFWMQAMQMMATNPALGAEYRIGDVFAYTARLAGLKGIDKFKMNVLTDEQILALLVNQNGGGNGANAGNAGTTQGTGGPAPAAEPEAAPAQGTPDLGGLASLF